MKLHEFTDRLYAMGGMEQEEKKSRRLNESYNDKDAGEIEDILANSDILWSWGDDNTIDFAGSYEAKKAQKLLNDAGFKGNIDFDEHQLIFESLTDTVEVEVELAVGENELDSALHEINNFGLSIKHVYSPGFNWFVTISGPKQKIIDYLTSDIYGLSYEEVKEYFPELLENSLTEARNTENDEVNAVKKHEKNMSDTVAKAKAKHPQYESLNLNESKQGLIDYFNELMSTFGVKPYDQIDYLLGYMGESELLDAIDDFKEYMDIDDEDIV